MPNRASHTDMRRDDILAQPRAAGTPMSTTILRRGPATPPLHGLRGRYRLIHQQIHRTLRSLRHHSQLTRTCTTGRQVAWALTPAGAATDEITAPHHQFADTRRGCGCCESIRS